MNKIIAFLDQAIDSIPKHIQELIQKMAIAIFFASSLIAITTGLLKGSEQAKPSGLQVINKNNDLFYLKQLKTINKHRNRLVEDVDYDFVDRAERNLKYKQYPNRVSRNLLSEPDKIIVPKDVNNIRREGRYPSFIPEEDSHLNTQVTRLPSNPMIGNTSIPDTNRKLTIKDSSQKSSHIFLE